MSQIQERGSTHVYKVNKISKEEVDSMVTRCVYENPPFCSAACPLKLDTRAMLKAAAEGDFKKALLLYEKIAVFPLILSAGCGEAPLDAPHPAILNAIYNATGARITRIPARPDKVLAALKALG